MHRIASWQYITRLFTECFMPSDDLRPSMVGNDFSQSALRTPMERSVAAAILLYLATYGDEWSEIAWEQFVSFLKQLPRDNNPPCAHEARSAFSYQLADMLSSAMAMGLITYRQTTHGNEHFAVARPLMEVYQSQPRKPGKTERPQLVTA